MNTYPTTHINQQPPEVLGNILYFSLPEHSNGTTTKEWWTTYTYLTSTCKNWKYVAIGTPEIWKRLYVKLNKNNPWLCWKLITAWKNILDLDRKSYKLTLTIETNTPSSHIGLVIRSLHLQNSLQELCLYAPIQESELLCYNLDQTITPNLKTLTWITNDKDISPNYAMESIENRFTAPILSTFNLLSTYLTPLTPRITSRLTNLHIHSPNSIVEEYVELLANCPTLISLTIETIESSETIAGNETGIELPFLGKLTVYPSPTPISILNHLTTPRLKTLCIKQPSNKESTSLQTLQNFIQQNNTNLKSVYIRGYTREEITNKIHNRFQNTDWNLFWKKSHNDQLDINKLWIEYNS
jgi:hypothetical protein